MTQREETEVVGPRLGGRPALGGLVMRVLLADGDSALWRDERFIEWFARRARRRAGRPRVTGADDATPPAATRTASLHAACSRRFGVRLYATSPHAVAGLASPPRAGIAGAACARVARVLAPPGGAAAARVDSSGTGEHWVELPDDIASGEYVALSSYENGMHPFVHDGDTILVAVGLEATRHSMVVVRTAGAGFACRRVCRITRSGIRLDALVPTSGSARLATRSALVGPVVAVWSPRRRGNSAGNGEDSHCRLL